MGIPARPRLTGHKKKDKELLEAYKRSCQESIHEGDIPHLPPGFPGDHLPSKVREALEKLGEEPRPKASSKKFQPPEPAEEKEA